MRTLILLFSLLLGTAHAFTPESGNWWNPNEPGSGFTFEIQDDFLFATIYTYDTDGRAAWYTAQGFMDGNDFFQGQMIRFRNGQCLGCNFTQNQQVPGVAFPISIEFTSEITAGINWPGGVDQIQRLNYFLGDYRDEAMRGQWQTTFDLRQPRGQYSFFGDVLVIDTLEDVGDLLGYSGCRPETSEIERCSSWARNNQELVGFAEVDAVNEHTIVLEDNPNELITYFVSVGTYQFDGFVQFSSRFEPFTAGPLYPVRGHRTASWRRVDTCSQGACSGPNGADLKVTPNTVVGQNLGDALRRQSGAGMTFEEAQASRPRMNLEAMKVAQARLVEELETRAAKRAIIVD